MEGEATGDGTAVSSCDIGTGSVFLGRIVIASLNDRCTACLGELGGRKCLLCVIVAADGVLDRSGRTVGVPGAASPRGTGLSLDHIDNEDGAREAPPPFPSLFIGIPPTTCAAVCWLAVPVCGGVGAFEVRSLLICALTFWKCLSYSQAACWRRNGCVTLNSSALFHLISLDVFASLLLVIQRDVLMRPVNISRLGVL